MGYLAYGNAEPSFELDRMTLAHLRLVTLTKLRRNESFALTVRNSDGTAETVWLHAAIPLRFIDVEEIELHRPLVLAMMNAAGSSTGLDLTKAEFAPALAGPTRLPMSA